MEPSQNILRTLIPTVRRNLEDLQSKVYQHTLDDFLVSCADTHMHHIRYLSYLRRGQKSCKHFEKRPNDMQKEAATDKGIDLIDLPQPHQ